MMFIFILVQVAKETNNLDPVERKFRLRVLCGFLKKRWRHALMMIHVVQPEPGVFIWRLVLYQCKYEAYSIVSQPTLSRQEGAWLLDADTRRYVVCSQGVFCLLGISWNVTARWSMYTRTLNERRRDVWCLMSGKCCVTQQKFCGEIELINTGFEVMRGRLGQCLTNISAR